MSIDYECQGRSSVLGRETPMVFILLVLKDVQSSLADQKYAGTGFPMKFSQHT
jgi:hypothetical protein